MPPAKVRTSTQSPFLIPRAAAVAGCSSISGCRARFAQTWQCAMLALTKQAGLGAGQDQRETVSQVGTRKRADWRFNEVRQGRIAVIKEGLGPEFDFPRRGREAAWVSLVVARARFF